MPGTFRIDGATSGLDFTAVIDALTALQRRSIQTLEGRVATQTNRKTGLLDLSSAILGVQTAAARLGKAGFFDGTGASSSNTSVLWLLGS